MSVSQEDLVRSKERDRKAVYLGSLVTAVVTPLLFALPELLLPYAEPFKLWYHDLTGTWIRAENPFTLLRFGGGCLGAAVAGWAVSDRGSGTVNGMKAAVYGLAIGYLLSVAFNLIVWPLVLGDGLPPVYSIVVVPFIWAIPLTGTHLVSGLLVGAMAGRIGRYLE
jgi:hypothetical protein